MGRDIHKSEFEEGTQIKLYIFKNYLKEWLPVFIKIREPWWNNIYIYDFFAGPGIDAIGQPGSPIILLEELKSFCNDLVKKSLNLTIVFNEFAKKKYKSLLENCSAKLEECRSNPDSLKYCPRRDTDNCAFELLYYNRDFKELFRAEYRKIIESPELPRFMFLDQNGIKHITESVFNDLINLERTDFIFFISSSFAQRFIENPEFSRYLKLSKQEFVENKPYHCHRVIFEYYRSLIPTEKVYYLYPFSIKKGANVYGLIFGSNHPLGAEKFLKVVWSVNEQTGEANFDIENEKINPDEPRLFPEQDKPNKLQFFETNLKKMILDGSIGSNREVYDYTFYFGCLPRHANSVLRSLIRDDKISSELIMANDNIHKLPYFKIKLINA